LLAPGANEDVAVAARRGADALEWELVREQTRVLLGIGVDQQHSPVGENQCRAIGERVHRAGRQEPPGQLPYAVRGEAHHFQWVECQSQDRFGLTKHFRATAIAALDAAVAEVREHFLESNRDRRRQERLELLFWLTPRWHERSAA